ncbi:ATPase [Vibrio sp. CAU 1672]|uniref:ATPase n=1 Tax=Vibrio sp. CAU 1672 TaxID=3032594 RepID=UPI0023DBC3C1|nr:ATPase [Vibrio sp. CAU 1672]MDF2155329.1 ATPase [Vibrio sp. CAU 1672]
MMNSLKWLLLVNLLCHDAIAGIGCNESSWNDNLTRFRALESNFNQHAETFNQLLAEHNQRQLLSQEFSQHELVLLWRAQANVNIFKRQLQAAKQYSQQLNTKANEIANLTKLSDSITQTWVEIADHCQRHGSKTNQISAEWYSITTQQLHRDIKQLHAQYLSLALLYDKEADALSDAQHLSN